MEAQNILRELGIKMQSLKVGSSEVRDRKSPSGVLKKFVTQLDGTTYYVKSGETSSGSMDFNILFPLSEVISYEIGSYLGFPVCKYELWEIPASNFLTSEELAVYMRHAKLARPGSIEQYLKSSGNILVSASPSFVDTANEDFCPCTSVYQSQTTGRALYEELSGSGIFTRAFLDKMILFDYLIANGDRHQSNFGVLIQNGGVYADAPLFDHGQALLSVFPDEYLAEYGTESFTEYRQKPFLSSDPYSWVSPESIGSLRLEAAADELQQRVNKYSPLLSNTRKDFINQLLEVRWNHVRKVLSQL